MVRMPIAPAPVFLPRGAFAADDVPDLRRVRQVNFEYAAKLPRKGRFLVELPGLNLIRYEEEATDFPKGAEGIQFGLEISWDQVKAGGAVVEYKNHRHFEASTNVAFH